MHMELSCRELRAPLIAGQVAFLFDVYVCKIVFGAEWTRRSAFATADDVRYAIEEGSAEGDARLSDTQVAAFHGATVGMTPARWRAYGAAKSGRVAETHPGDTPALAGHKCVLRCVICRIRRTGGRTGVRTGNARARTRTVPRAARRHRQCCWRRVACVGPRDKHVGEARVGTSRGPGARTVFLRVGCARAGLCARVPSTLAPGTRPVPPPLARVCSLCISF